MAVPALESIEGGIRPAAPARISIPAAGVDAVVDPVRSDALKIEVPDVGRAGWMQAGPRPGEPGRAIVIGHFDTRKRPGLFARVPKARPGTEVEIIDRIGRSHRYSVVGSTQVKKARFPNAAVYGASKRPTLVLITCGGPYEEGKGYRDSVLVYARAA